MTAGATLDDGTGTLTFEPGSAFEAGLGATLNDKLTKIGFTTPAGVFIPSGDVIIKPGARLLGFNVGGASSNILEAGVG